MSGLGEGAARTVYIADDSPVARRAIAKRLRAEGFRIVENESAVVDRGLDVGSLACALLDLDLGDGDGTDVAAELRRVSPALPIAFFSGGATPEILARAKIVGPVFAKPAELEKAIAWVCASAR